MGKVSRKQPAAVRRVIVAEANRARTELRTELKKENPFVFAASVGRPHKFTPYTRILVTCAYFLRTNINAFHRSPHCALAAKLRLNGSRVVALRNQVLDAFGRNSAEGRSRADYWPTDHLVNSFHQKLPISHVGALLAVQYFNF